MPVEPTAIQIELANAIKRFQSFGGADLTKALSSIESELASNTIDTCESALAVAGATAEVLGAAVAIIDGIDVMVAQTLVSEVGLDMSRWKTEAHFASWLGLCPDNRISGDKVLSKGTRGVVNRAATALRQAASTLLRSRSYLALSIAACAFGLEPQKPSLQWPID
jgi:hypothetical protein